jgi:flagellar biosynthesis protein
VALMSISGNSRMATDSPKRVVALRYNPQQDVAPVLVAKGQGVQADAILAVARRNGVPVREDRALVAVLSQLEVDRQIPPQLYTAVATIIAFLQRANRPR